MMHNYLEKIIPLTILIVGVASVQGMASVPIGNTTIWWLIQTIVLLIFLVSLRYGNLETESTSVMVTVKLYLLWNVISILRGFFLAEVYWDWKGLILNTFALILPIVAYTASNKEILQSMLSFYLRYALPFYLLIFPVLPIGAIGSYLYPVAFLVLFIPALTPKGKAIVFVLALSGILCDLSTRSYILKYGIPILMLIFYYSKYITYSTPLIEFSRKAFMFIPWLFFFLAISGVFNIFRMDEYLNKSYVATTKNAEGEVIEQDITKDSRTFLFEEVLSSAKKHNYWIIGRSPARGNETSFFDWMDASGRGERLRNEAGILNVFTWTGIVGVILYFFVFYRASWIAINQSNNIYSKLTGLFVSFRWMYAWAEDINMFNLNYFMIWVMIGICFSHSFRKMNDAEVKLWVRGIFEKKYYRKYREYILEIH
ncbi:hypothetical protein [Gaoshiqia sediminis]|uniref:Uncharacterized protein n=1 Tax=Gaoshiqia sediminis TaxID=2986998 RepID=A0AA42C8W1_9BACT|nr:hypothetical protein [Gaoshiqia sediminis]MCW0483181.1 hypothetical protein [Gaoshiqia sediminis]